MTSKICLILLNNPFETFSRERIEKEKENLSNINFKSFRKI